MNAEYVSLHEAADIAAVFKVRTEPLRSFQWKEVKDETMFTAHYHVFQQLQSTKLMTRSGLGRWLLAIFFKIALPMHRPVGAQRVDEVDAPLNLTAFFRILRMLHAHKYPSHWLAETLVAILENKVRTDVRPPRSFPLDPEDTAKTYPNARMDLAPFMLEMRTLTAIWSDELPFGIPSIVPMPPLSRLRQYTIRIPNIISSYGPIQLPIFSLLFCPFQSFQEVVFGIFRYDKVYKWDVRKCLLSDEKRDVHSYATRLRKTCAVVTTWTWDPSQEEPSFWMDEEVTCQMQDVWYVSVLRTDSWVCVAQQQPLTKARAGECWMTCDVNQP
jgi:hypothetical protein